MIRKRLVRSQTAVDAVGARLARSLDRATYEGYRVGFEAARAEAARLAEAQGRHDLAESIQTLEPLPDRRRRDA